MRIRLALILIAALIAISSAAVLAKLANTTGVIAAWWRLLVGTLVLSPVWITVKGLRKPSQVSILLFSGTCLAIHFTLWLESLRYISVAASTGIVVTYPVWIAVVEAIRGDISLKSFLGVVLAVTGVIVLSEPWRLGVNIYGSTLSLLAAWAASAYFLIGHRARTEGIDTLTYTTLVYGSALLVVSIYSALQGVNPLDVTPLQAYYLMLMGLGPMAIGHTGLNYALKYMPASIVTSIALLEPFGASLLAWLILGEKLTTLTLVGLILTTTGALIALASHQEAQR